MLSRMKHLLDQILANRARSFVVGFLFEIPIWLVVLKYQIAPAIPHDLTGEESAIAFLVSLLMVAGLFFWDVAINGKSERFLKR